MEKKIQVKNGLGYKSFITNEPMIVVDQDFNKVGHTIKDGFYEAKEIMLPESSMTPPNKPYTVLMLTSNILFDTTNPL